MTDRGVSSPRPRCPDDGACHHGCEPGVCWRVHNAGPLSGVYPYNQWPQSVSAAVPHVYMSTSCLHSLHGRCVDKGAQCKFCEAKCVCRCHRADERVRGGEPDPHDVMERVVAGMWPIG